jgi:carbon-monoxide dehydrogenase large subunit
VVAVDTRTGAVAFERYVVAEDCGPVVDRAVVDGQVRGAVAQAIGSVLLEEVRYDAEGQHLNATLQDYLVPGIHDVPDIEIAHVHTPSPFSEGGYKGVGESGTIGGPAAVVGAIADALGVRPERIELPLTPERVLALIADPDA